LTESGLKRDDVEVEKLFWVDLEMTGLEVEKEVIIEAAAIVTDMDFNVLDSYNSIVKQEQKYLDAMDDWNQRQHTKTGLKQAVPNGKETNLVEKDLVQLIEKHFKEPAVMAGNSISQDKIFVKKYFPNLYRKLHYRILDISSWKVIMKEKFNTEYKKDSNHRALDDIRDSISELKHYLQFIKIPE